MGAGTPEDLVECVGRGIDMFDCVLPTRNARNGQLFTSLGRINIKNARYAEDDGPVDPACRCYTCTHHSRAYLRHLHLAGEMTAGALNTLHNLAFYLDTMKRIREAIKLGTFDSFRQEFLRSAEVGHHVVRLKPDTTIEYPACSRLMSLLDPFLLAMATPQGGSPNPWLQLIPFALILGIFYFVMVLPMRKRQQKVHGVSRRAEGWRSGHHDRRHLRIDHAVERPVRAAAGRQQRAHRSLACGDRWIPGAGPRRPRG